MGHSNEQVDVQVCHIEVKGVDEALHHKHIENGLCHEVASLLSKVLSELSCCIATFPLSCVKVNEELWSLNKLILVILGCLLDDISIVAKLFKDAFVELVSIKNVGLRGIIFFRVISLYILFLLRYVAFVLTAGATSIGCRTIQLL